MRASTAGEAVGASIRKRPPHREAKALLFHNVQRTWEEQFARLEPILTGGAASPAERLRLFTRELMLVEAAEADLRRGLRAASVELRETSEFKALLARGTALFHGFLADALGARLPDGLDFTVEAAAILITSFTERATDQQRSQAHLLRQADFLADLLIARFAL